MQLTGVHPYSHTSHHVLAIYALGASPELIKDSYNNSQLPKLLPIPVSPNRITEKDFAEHLGDEKYISLHMLSICAINRSKVLRCLPRVLYGLPTAELTDRSPRTFHILSCIQLCFGPWGHRSCFGEAPPDVGSSTWGLSPSFHSRLLWVRIWNPWTDRRRYVLVPLTVKLTMPIAFLISGLAQAAIHKANQTEVIPPSYFATSAATGNGLLSSFMSTLSLVAPGSNHVLLREKRPAFAFHRRIRDDPAFHVELPSGIRQWYLTAVKAVGGAIHNLVQEWTAEWLTGIRSDADAEVRLEGMVEEVVWGNVIWYGVGGWATRGDSGRAMNADFFLCVSSLIASNTTSR